MKATLKKISFTMIIGTVASLLTVLCLGSSDLVRHGEKMKTVSLVELIANPEKFDGQRVFVQGFVRLEFEGTGLYFHEEDYRYGLRYNGVALSMTPAERDQVANYDLSYRTIIGTYHATPSGYTGLWSGSLSDVKFVGDTTRSGMYRPQPKEVVPQKTNL